MNIHSHRSWAFALLLIAACQSNKHEFDATGAFETEETIISAEGSGELKQFSVEEGQTLKAGQVLGYIDTVQLYLKKKQLETQVGSILSQRPDADAQTAAIKIQLRTAERDKQRIQNLVDADAAPAKQLDDINAQIDMLKKQLAAQQSSLRIATKSIGEQTNPVWVQVQQLDDQIEKCRIVNHVNGTVLEKYAEQFEIVAPGKPLYKIADLSTMILRAYISEAQLTELKLGQHVTVMVDQGADSYKGYEGMVEWISSKAEFTPKTIQTKDERANMVYAVKIRVKNDGFLKIGMYGEVNW